MKSDAERLVDLEVRYTLQQDQLEQLSQVIWEQQRVIERLRSRLEALEGRDSQDGATGPVDEVPPHY